MIILILLIKTGDPTGTGKSGTSIWGRKFEDEIKSSLKVIVALNISILSYVIYLNISS